MPGDDPDGLYVLATVDVKDTDAVVDVYIDRLLTLQIDDGLLIYVVPLRMHPQRVTLSPVLRKSVTGKSSTISYNLEITWKR